MTGDERHILTVDEDGRIGAIYSDALLGVFKAIGLQADIKRASDVEPTRDGKWRVWVRDWVPGGRVTFGPFATRAEALAVERAYLEEVL